MLVLLLWGKRVATSRGGEGGREGGVVFLVHIVGGGDRCIGAGLERF